jgi:hypothetical protein
MLVCQLLLTCMASLPDVVDLEKWFIHATSRQLVHKQGANRIVHCSCYLDKQLSCARNLLLPHLPCLQGLAAACHALEVQLWSCLQSFANWPTDAAAAYTGRQDRQWRCVVG